MLIKNVYKLTAKAASLAFLLRSLFDFSTAFFAGSLSSGSGGSLVFNSLIKMCQNSNKEG